MLLGADKTMTGKKRVQKQYALIQYVTQKNLIHLLTFIKCADELRDLCYGSEIMIIITVHENAIRKSSHLRDLFKAKVLQHDPIFKVSEFRDRAVIYMQ